MGVNIFSVNIQCLYRKIACLYFIWLIRYQNTPVVAKRRVQHIWQNMLTFPEYLISSFLLESGSCSSSFLFCPLSFAIYDMHLVCFIFPNGWILNSQTFIWNEFYHNYHSQWEKYVFSKRGKNKCNQCKWMKIIQRSYRVLGKVEHAVLVPFHGRTT